MYIKILSLAGIKNKDRRKNLKQLRNIKKKVGSLLLAMAMIVTSVPVLSHEVYAEDNELPGNTQFATVDKLKSFNTNDNDGTINPAKVYFGSDNQQWWIAGSQQKNGLTLFAASPLATQQKFATDQNNKTYDTQWNCTYPNTVPTSVYSNHYGASPLRTTLQDLENSYFTSSEKNLMNDTTIFTNDTKNNSVYSTTNKLYLAYGIYDSNKYKYIMVGTNSEDSLSNGLHIDSNYWGNRGKFWLRAPYVSNSNIALIAFPSDFVRLNLVDYGHAVVPAFELKLSSVIFASAAPAASSDGQLTTEDTDGNGAFTLRYSTNTLGSAQVSYGKSKVILSNVPSGTYLIAQNSNGAYAKRITDGMTSVSASDMGLDSFKNCKVWLETADTTNRMTYATLATEKQEIAVNISAGTGLSITSSNGVQEVAPNTPITDITVKADNGYYLPDDYKYSIQGLNGLTVTNFAQNGFTISGTPTDDVNIKLPVATVSPKADTPAFDTTQTANSITVVVTNYQASYGTIQYRLDNSQNWISVNESEFTISELVANNRYKVSVRFSGQGIYQMSDEKTVDISTAPATYEITIPMTVSADNSENMISINATREFDLGYNGKVNVKIKNTSAMTDGVLSLTRENGSNEIITSVLLVGGKQFTDLSKNVATFSNKDDKAIPFVFKKPTNTNILAGTYKGTIVFDISYSED